MIATSRSILVLITLLTLSVGRAESPPDAAAPGVPVPTDPRAATILEGAAAYLRSEDWPTAIRLLQHVLDGDEVFVPLPGKDKVVKVWRNARAEADRLLGAMPAAGKELYEKTYGPAAAELLEGARKLHDRDLFAAVARRYPRTAAGREARRKVELLALARRELSPPVSHGDWPVYRGDATRTAEGDGGAAFLQPRWQQPMIYLDRDGTTSDWLKKAASQMKSRRQPILLASFPVTVTVTKRDERLPLVFFKNYWGVQAVNVKTGKIEWNSPSQWSLERMVGKGMPFQKSQALNSWLQFYIDQAGRPGALFENSICGTLSTDGDCLYAVEDLAVPPPAHFAGLPKDGYPGDVGEAVRHNRLQAFRIPIGGKLDWEAGGVDDKKHPLYESFFLGPPLPLGGLLYSLTQKGKDLRLVCLDPKAKGKVVFVHPLGKTADTLVDDPRRRMEAANLAAADGVLVIPTNAGVIFGFDLAESRLLWAHSYRDKEDLQPDLIAHQRRGGLPPGWIWGPNGQPMNPNGLQSLWKVSAPAIHDGKVVFTGTDARSLTCVNLRDGSPVWSQPRQDDDLYFAGVVKGRALVVNKKRMRALSLDKGETVWDLETGVPSGQGVAAGGVYYLPLSEAARTREPEVCAIDVAKGEVVAHTRSRKKVIPGNLLFSEGNLVSLTADALTVYPLLKTALGRFNEVLAKNPNDPAGLTERGVMRLDNGDLVGAIADLRKALSNDPPPDVRARARAELHPALTQLLQRDFTAAEPFLKEYEDLTKEITDGAAPDERTARRASYLLLIGRGREGQGKLVDALKAYLDLAALGGEELTALEDDPGLKVRLDVFARRRIEDMLKKASPEQLKLIEEEIGKRRQKSEGAKDPGELRGFAAVFGPGTASGRAARLTLAARLIEEGGGGDREADRLLQEVRGQKQDAGRAAHAVEMLARLCTRCGLPADAGHYYRILGRDFANVVLADGRTGRDVWDDLATDKRMLPYMDKGPRFPAGRIRVLDEDGEEPKKQAYVFGHRGEGLPYFREHSLALDLGTGRIDLRGGGAVPLSLDLVTASLRLIVEGYAEPSAVRLPYHTVGHLVVLPAGDRVLGIDPVHRKLLWEKRLAPGTKDPGWNHVLVEHRDGSIRVFYVSGWVQRLGRPPVLGPSVLCLTARDGLEGIDPLTGKTLWRRSEVGVNSDLFGDEEFVGVVETNHEGGAALTRVVRTSDGAVIPAPKFAGVYDKRLSSHGRLLLAADGGADGLTLRLYDVAAGADVWKQTFPAGTVPLHSRDANLAGAVAPDGSLHIIDLSTRKLLPPAKVDPAALDKAEKIHLLADDDRFYVAVQGPADPAIARFGGVQSNLMPGLGLQQVPVNGRVYAFDRATGERLWFVPAPNQMLLLDHFREVPVLLFTSRYTKLQAAGGGRTSVMQSATLLGVDKRSGKKLVDRQDNATQPFHSLNVDPHAGRIEVVGANAKIVLLALPPVPKP